MLQGQAPSAIDELQGRLPPSLKWCLMGAGGATGWYYARTDMTPIPLSYIALGAGVGYCLVAGVFAGLRLMKAAAVVGVLLLAVNYAFLIPFGFGDYVPVGIDACKAALRWLDPAPLARRWGKSVEIRPSGR